MMYLTRRENVELFLRENLETLEDVLHQNTQEYLRIKKNEELYPTGRKINLSNVNSFGSEVAGYTAKYLEIKNPPLANYSMTDWPKEIVKSLLFGAGVFSAVSLAGYCFGDSASEVLSSASTSGFFASLLLLLSTRQFNSSSSFTKYSSLFKEHKNKVHLRESKEIDAVGAISHEYTHCLQYRFTRLGEGFNPIFEGHARTVQGKISNIFAEVEDNEGYNLTYFEMVAQELKDAYLFTCDQMRVTPKKSLLNSEVKNIRFGRYALLGHHYSIGVAAMQIANLKFGESVNLDVIRNKYSFLDVES